MAISIKDQISNQYKYGGATIKLIAWNVIFTFAIWIGEIIFQMFDLGYGFDLFVYEHLFAHSHVDVLIRNPWSIITSMFMHGNFFHLLFNMIALYFMGRILQQIVSSKRIYFLYFAGGIAAFIIHVIATNGLPYFKGADIPVLGASGAVAAIFIALATLRPHLDMYLYGVFKVKIMYLAIAFVVIDFFSVNSGDSVAHFAHLGGALFGYLWAFSYQRGNDWSRFFKFGKISNPFKRKSKIRVVHNSRNTTAKTKIDDDYNESKISRQKQIDAILDKIKASGYDSLSKKEKEFLFRESQNL